MTMARIRRGATTISGIVAIDKPLHSTSHDVVNRIRFLTGEGRVGHAGTLDPLATGLLLVCIGPATRLSHYLIKHDKVYQARISFGSATTTDDAEGEVIASSPVPDVVSDELAASSFLMALSGEHEQLPPAFSAIKKNGQVAYKQARKGEQPELEPRRILIREALLEAIGNQYWDVRFTVSAGTYIRALARDIGQALGTCAHLGSLRRVRCGNSDIAQAFKMDQLDERVERCFIDPVDSLGFPVVSLDGSQKDQVRSGKALCWERLRTDRDRQMQRYSYQGIEGELFSVVADNELLAIYRRDSEATILLPDIVLSGGVRGVR